MDLILVLAGLIILVVAGEFLVRASVSLALWMKVSTLVIGLTVVSFATSAPELMVSLQAALTGNPEISIGNVIGSNIANIALIMGLTAAFYRLPVSEPSYRFDWVFMMAATILVFFFLKSAHQLVFWEGAVLLIGLFYFNYKKIADSRKSTKQAELESEVKESYEKRPLWQVFALLFVGIVGLKYGAQFLVDGASSLALSLGIEKRVISLSVVAFGTSIPELAASIMAARKNQTDLAVGNLIGSNIFNLLAVLGGSAMVIDIPVSNEGFLKFDYWWMLIFAVVLFFPIFVSKRKFIGKITGSLFLGGYIVYLYLISV